jgi:hypothetical protein
LATEPFKLALACDDTDCMMARHTVGASALSIAIVIGTAGAQAATRNVCGTTPSGTAIVAVGPTSCPFAKEVVRKWRSYGTVEVAPGIFGGPSKTIRVYSSAVKRRVTMHCREHVEKDNIFGLCTGGNGARVEVRS